MLNVCAYNVGKLNSSVCIFVLGHDVLNIDLFLFWLGAAIDVEINRIVVCLV